MVFEVLPLAASQEAAFDTMHGATEAAETSRGCPAEPGGEVNGSSMGLAAAPDAVVIDPISGAAEFSFGYVEPGQRCSRHLRLSAQAIPGAKIVSVKSNCRCVRVSGVPASFGPQGLDLVVELDPPAEPGVYRKTVTITTDAPSLRRIVLGVSADILQPLAVQRPVISPRTPRR
jgi:hypothetical protein